MEDDKTAKPVIRKFPDIFGLEETAK